MRCMTRNKSKFYYAFNIGESEILDDELRSTGEYMLVHSPPLELFGNISAAQGEVQNRQFGESESYDKVIVLDDKDVRIDEHSILWVDTLPHLNEYGFTDTPHDYVVKRIARSLNGVSIAISKVDVS